MEHGEDALTPDKLKEIFDQEPTQLLQDASPHLHELAVFVLKYGQCAANRDQLLKNVTKDQKDAFCKDPETEKKNEFRCVADYLTKTDLGWTAWQFVNSYHDWTKKMGTMSRSVKFSCGTEFTSGCGDGRKRGGHCASPEGMEFYKKLVAFFGDLKTDSKYNLFWRICNAKSKSFGLLRELKENAVAFQDDGSDDDEDVDEVPTVPCFNVGEADVCVGIEPYAV
jgi:hypothetical protein